MTSGGVTETATVNVTVTAVADIANDTATTNEDTAVNILVLGQRHVRGHARDHRHDQRRDGTVAVNNNGTPGDTTDDFVVYTPNADFNGTDSFTYTVTSGGVTETATVNVTITAVADIADDTGDRQRGHGSDNFILLPTTRSRAPPAITGTTNGAQRHGRRQQQRHARRHHRRLRRLYAQRRFQRHGHVHLHGDFGRRDRDGDRQRHRQRGGRHRQRNKTTTNEDVQTTFGLVISRSPADDVEVTTFLIGAITNGTLFQNDAMPSQTVNTSPSRKRTPACGSLRQRTTTGRAASPCRRR